MKKYLPTDPSILFSQVPILSEVKVSIVIPVKNEERYIKDCLAAFLNQINDEGLELNKKIFEILIIANNCTDHSVCIIQQFKEENSSLNIHVEDIILEEEHANIGFVRKTLMDIAYSRLCKNGGGIIMTTDSDTVVSRDWIYQNICEINNGADAVGGRILFNEEESVVLDSSISLFHKKDEEYQLLAAELASMILKNFDFGKPCHHQHFNGSFAVTSICYQTAGGVPHVKHLEDCAFYEKLESVDAKIRHSNRVKVHTSARYCGRADVGLANQLLVWKNMEMIESNFLVESCESLVNRLIIKRKIRDLWNKKENNYLLVISELEKIDKHIIFDDSILKNYAVSYYGEWFNEIKILNEIHWNEMYASSPINTAILKLKESISNYSD
ncbi:hypothetical protein A5893_01225 [Pedobacter psychrophilus]|uniref:Glycosyltransferase 2-like domain-containing protein n=1 Tax=Pedobacter psychrophilus TaxID=1826909 RepID=A0A179DKX8_9SPHI|nr:glycosyltransferase [Pedobacter psychrophilus]OAQ41766.1 hypothetical protein A5893_01225 [Pedobacter psychrophilus]